LVLFVKSSIVLCWLDIRICWFVMMFCISVIYVVIAADIVWGIVSSRLCWIASVNNVTSVVTDDSLCMLLLTISAISISRLVGPLVDLALDCFVIVLSVGVLIALSLVCRAFGPTECDSLRNGCRSLSSIS
jgi:hypothetical protein